MSDDTFKLSFDVEPTDQALPLIVLLDDQIVWQNTVEQKCKVEIRCLENIEQPEHVLKIVLHGKDSTHTTLDANNNIIADSSLQFSNFLADDINITQLVIDRNTYQHNFNGNGSETTEQFFGTMGCNGTVTFKFSTPLYIWLLENI